MAKGKAKPKLTDEEKLLLKEQQALAAQEEKARRAELALKFLKVDAFSLRWSRSRLIGETGTRRGKYTHQPEEDRHPVENDPSRGFVHQSPGFVYSCVRLRQRPSTTSCAHYHAEKANDIKEEINILSQTFERVLDRKQAVVQSLMQDLMEAEQQDYMASQSHVYSLDKLLLFQQKRLEEVCAPLSAELPAHARV
jgi:hypothetical protein